MFRVNKSISIDLGTANILIYDKQKKKIVLNEPSVVARDKKTGKVIAVGKEAREMLGKTPASIEAIKPLQDGVIADIESTKEMLSYFIHKIYGNSLFKPEVMICVPIQVSSIERKALFDAVRGAKKTYIIEEGRAAIIGSGINISQPEGNMVVDIGGGSTDIAILSLDEIIASKSLKIAGNKFDEDIVKYVKRKHNILIGERTAEKIKKELGTAIPEANPEKMDIKGRDLETGIPNTVEINANEIYEAIEDSLYQIVNSAKEVLEKCPPELAADILDNGIVMTGGGSLIKNLIEMMEKEIGIKVYLAENPLDSVVLGGGIAFDNKKLLKTLQMREN
ncbi:MAG: rod shape-determining protein [Leptotrichiaceae bacterium]|nr:rod shape-determining protein [Leptotrichiaceae bacterium]MBP6281203.1 rod shape-determining protein [Leptotrichiaceae bacterium]MBP7100553.1 rod shape-determining protein [Leptotrichiaceae bacterium]MBP7739746.1 rod shape-determining protein [Leptotrichiaceae bacterium]MBP9630313.1 rod shape-determining protein [Leptotrichiaceae bacterium]